MKSIEVDECGFPNTYSVRNDTECENHPRFIWNSRLCGDSGEYRTTYQEAWNDMIFVILGRLQDDVESASRNLANAKESLALFKRQHISVKVLDI